MPEVIRVRREPSWLGLRPRAEVEPAAGTRQAFRLLHAAFVLAPLVAGFDKFTHLLTNWNQYLAPSVARLSPIGPQALMQLVGAVEILVAALVLVKPRVGGIVVAAWLGAIIFNLLALGGYYDIALRDFGLALAALALSKLAAVWAP
jgi:hypothetical protein